MMRSSGWLSLVVLLGACALQEVPGTQVTFDLEADWGDPDRFFDFPYPSDLRLTGAGGPEVEGFPNPGRNDTVESLRAIAGDRRGFSTIQAAYFRFSAPLAPRRADEVISAEADSPVLLIDVDPASPDRGRLFPTVAVTLEEDDYLPPNVLAVAPRPGIVLHPKRTYAYVVRRSLGDRAGEPLGVPLSMETVKAGRRAAVPRGEAIRVLYDPLWKALGEAEVRLADVAAATVFTTGDVVQELSAITDTLLAEHSVEIADIRLDPDDGNHPRYCELVGKVRYPRFQQGTPPYDTGGLFEFDTDTRPLQQGEEDAPVVITLPKGEMPADGYPLLLYFHGSGGLHSEVVDRGRTTTAGGQPTKGEGPAHVLAPFGLAAAGSAMPVNPERVPGASDIAYLNFANLPAFRDTFRQGVIEQRLFLSALLDLEIDPEVLGACSGPRLPDGRTRFRFDAARVVGMGQSMGGMYTNMVGAVEPRIRAVVPTGAGGYWTYFILLTSLVPGAETLVAGLVGSPPPLSYLHPVLQLAQAAWEPAEPMVYTPRLARRPLQGHPVRHIYQPVGLGDRYFPEPVFDALALAYGNEQAGEVVWDSMAQALALEGRDELLEYPVVANLLSERDGEPYTGVVVQYAGDGLSDPHNVAFQLDAVKRQYACFLDTFLATGTALVPAPGSLATACPRP